MFTHFFKKIWATLQLVRLLPLTMSKYRAALGSKKSRAEVLCDMMNLIWKQFGLAVMLKFSPEDFVEEYFMERIYLKGHEVKDYTLDCEAIRILWLSNLRQLRRIELLGNKDSCWHYLTEAGIRTTERLGEIIPGASNTLLWRTPQGGNLSLSALFQSHPRIFVKPANGCKGELCNRLSMEADGSFSLGIQKLTAAELSALVKRPLLIEEVLVNHPDVERFHPASLNTIRFITMRDDDGNIYLEKAIFRMGVHCADVDNLSLGGIGVELLADGTLAPWGHYFDPSIASSTEHPDTHLTFSGFKMPYYDQCVEMALTVHRMNPKLNRIGFDICVSPTGPVLVEINPFSQTFQAWKGGMRQIIHSRYLKSALAAARLSGEIL